MSWSFGNAQQLCVLNKCITDNIGAETAEHSILITAICADLAYRHMISHAGACMTNYRCACIA